MVLLLLLYVLPKAESSAVPQKGDMSPTTSRETGDRRPCMFVTFGTGNKKQKKPRSLHE